MLYYYNQKLMGGGDVKLFAVAFLWTGPWCTLPFALFLLIFVGLHAAAAKFGWVEVQVREDKRKRIPLALSIAGALIENDPPGVPAADYTLLAMKKGSIPPCESLCRAEDHVES